MLEAEIFQLVFDPADAQAIGQRRVDFERLFRNGMPLRLAQMLERARIIDAAIGLVLGPGIFILLVGWAAMSWLRYGKDPVYLDDPSILMPAPPPDLTAAAGAVIWEGRSTRRALTTAMLDSARSYADRLLTNG